jgi:hypothetical protein
MRSRSLFIPLFLIVMGSLWFIKSIDLMPETSSIIAIGLAVLGLVVLITDGINKQSIVAGPFLMYLGAAVYLYYEEWFRISHILSVGMVVLGSLLLLSRSGMVPDKYARHLFPPQD